MKFFQSDIPFYLLIEYIIVGVLLLLSSNFISRYIIPLIKKRTTSITPLWQKTQIIICLIFLVLLFSDLLRLYTAISILVTVIVLGLGWNYWKNVFIGILIVFNDQFKVGDFISTNQVKGTIKSINLSYSELLNENGELVIIPNSKLKNKIFTHLTRIRDANICVFTFKNAQNQSPEAIYKLAYDCPYLSANQKITVEKKEKDEYIIRATIIDNLFMEYADNYFAKASKLHDSNAAI